MSKIAKKLTDLIGNTPLLELSNFNKKYAPNAAIIGKLEYFNPGGSVKDRIALAMIEDAEEGCSNRAARSSSRPAATPEWALRSSQRPKVIN